MKVVEAYASLGKLEASHAVPPESTWP